MNLIQFLKNWTLPVAMLTGTILYLTFAFVPALDGTATFFAPIFDSILLLFMFFILFVTFCNVDFHQLRLVRWHLWVTLIQLLLIALIVGLIFEFGMTGNSLILMEAILACIICPGATAAPVVTKKLGGNIEEVTANTFFSNFITAALVPIIFPLIDADLTMSFMQSFLLILYKVCLILIVPMLLAYVVKHYMKSLHRRIISVPDLAYYTWGCSLMIVTGTTVKNIIHANTTASFLLLIASLGLLVCITQFALGRWVGAHFNRPIEAGQALGQKNTAFAIWIAYTYLNPLSSVGPGCYILWQNTINSFEIWKRRKKMEKSLPETKMQQH